VNVRTSISIYIYFDCCIFYKES